MKQSRKRYDKAFKLMVIELVKSGKSTKTISEDLGVSKDNICRWHREYEASQAGIFSGQGNRNLSETERKVLALEKQLKEVELENEILKKAVRIFSRKD
jgi:transposase